MPVDRTSSSSRVDGTSHATPSKREQPSPSHASKRQRTDDAPLSQDSIAFGSPRSRETDFASIANEIARQNITLVPRNITSRLHLLKNCEKTDAADELMFLLAGHIQDCDASLEQLDMFARLGKSLPYSEGKDEIRDALEQRYHNRAVPLETTPLARWGAWHNPPPEETTDARN